MPRRSFTDTWIRNLRPHEVRRDFTEAGRPGFMLRLWPAGQRTFVLRYMCGCTACLEANGGKPRTRIMTLGQYPVMSLEQAHEEHAAARKLLGKGIDPIEERGREAKVREGREQRERAAQAITVRNVVAEWAWHYARRERKHPHEALRLLKVYVATPWSGRPCSELVKRDAVLLLDRIKARAPVMANRVRNLALQAFTFAVSRDLIQNNPFLGTERPGGEEDPRDRRLTADEVKTFWTALERDDTEMSRLVQLGLRLILVTAQRPGEVAGATWSEIDTKRAVWTIPPERSKNGRAHEVPLSDLALEIIAELRRHAADRPALLASWQSKLKRDEPIGVRALSRALKNNHDRNGKLFGLPPFTPHDLRRTAASSMTSLGIPRLHVSKVLNHTDHDITGAVYDQHDYGPEKKKALDRWAQELRAIIEGKERKVVPIAKKRRA